jgi:excisionase family DNA binding protein
MLRKREKTFDAVERLLTVDEAAAILGLKPSTLYTWASVRRISTVKVGRALRIGPSYLHSGPLVAPPAVGYPGTAVRDRAEPAAAAAPVISCQPDRQQQQLGGRPGARGHRR